MRYEREALKGGNSSKAIGAHQQILRLAATALYSNQATSLDRDVSAPISYLVNTWTLSVEIERHAWR